MPWDAQSFADRHNHALHGERAGHAARIANAVLRSGAPEGIAIATANKWAQHHATGGIVRRDAGGYVDPTQQGIGGIAPSAQSMNPMIRGLVQRYAALPVEQLQELAARAGGSQQGQLIQSVLRQKQVMPQAQPQQGAPQTGGIAPQVASAPMPGQQMQMPQVARGGIVPHLAMGGDPMGLSASAADPWWEKQEAYGSERPLAGGFLAGSSPGRADTIRTQAPGGAYVLPADVIAGLGEGNSLAGARVAQEMFGTGPHGIPLERSGRGRGPPTAPRLPMPQAKGGGVQRGALTGTPVALSHGEYVVHPAAVARLGGGNLRRGHKVLDLFVKRERAKQIGKLKKLPGPVKAK